MRRILFCAALLFAAVQALAAPVDPVTAKAKAQNFVQQHLYSGKLRAPLSGQMTLAHAEMNSKKVTQAVYYIFNASNGYVIVSGDDRAEEILGYGDAPIDFNNIPCNMKAWLATYKEQIEYLQAHPGMRVETPSMMAPSLRTASVAPLLSALWDQEAPYWNMCKINNNQCLTGCPATSAAMVFYYWRFPDYETPQVPAYRCELSTSSWGGASYVNVPALPPVTFDWENMRDSYSGNYTTAEADAVATLMRYVGQAERMAYGTTAAGGSGVDADSVSLIADAFKFFGYDEETVRVVKKTSSYSGGTTLYSDAEWAAMIQEELSEERPIVFCAIAGGFFGGGHAFNIDGYDANTNKYHINFGWSGVSNNYYALNSFTGQGSTFNQYQQMVIGIQPPIKAPRLKADLSEMSMECYKNQTATSKFKLTGRNLDGNVTVSLNDENDVFSISASEVAPDVDGKVSQTITVTYAPKKEGQYTGTITCHYDGLEDIVITVHGASHYELYRPVILPANDEYVTSTSFRAEWTDNTPAENVVNYSLEVWEKPDIVLLAEGDWSNVPAENTNHARDAQNYLPEDWTFNGSNFYLDGGFISASRNSVLSPNCDLTGYGKVSVIIKAKNYMRTGVTTQLYVSSDVESDTLMLSKDVDTYLSVLNLGSHPTVKIIMGNYPEIQSIKVYGGEITDPEPFALRAPVETGDAVYRLIEGITPDRFYTVNGLNPATPYLFRVKSTYVNGTESRWSVAKEVLTKEAAVTMGDVNSDGILDVADVIDLISYVLNGDASGIDLAAANINGDDLVDISDVASLIEMLLNGSAQ
jgi:hypothetical protein